MFIMVDLDRTFFKMDINIFLFKSLLKNDFFFAMKLLFYLLFKGGWTKVSMELSPYLDGYNLDEFVNDNVLAYLRMQKDVQIVLATGSYKKIAQKVVEKYNDIFSGYIASDATYHCVGVKKLKKIKEYVKGEPFFYIGDSFTDLEVWKEAAKIGVVNPTPKLLKRIKALEKECLVFYV